MAGEFGRDLACGFGEAVEGPAFGGAVFCAGAEPEGEREGRFERWEDWVVEGGVFDIGAETPCDAEVESGVVFDGADFFLGRDDLVEEFAAPVALVADDAEDAGEFHFEGGAETIREEDAGVPWVVGLFEEPCDGEDGGVFGEGDDHVDVRDHAPDGGDFFRDEDGDAGVGAAAFEGADGGDSHAGVAEPVRRAHEDVEGLEGICGHGVGEGDAAAVLCEEEFRVGGFPAVVDPEPVVWGAADIGFEGDVECGGGEFDVRGGVEFGADDHAPAAWGVGDDGDREDGGTGFAAEESGEIGGGGETVEERGPLAGVAGVLIDEDADAAVVAEPADGAVEAVVAVEEPAAGALAAAEDVGVEEGVGEGLVHGASAGACGDDDLGEDLPVAHVEEGVDEAAAGFEGEFDVFDSFDGEVFFEVIDGDPRHFETAEEIAAEGGEVLAGELVDAGGGEIAAEGDGEVAVCEFAVGGEEESGEGSGGGTDVPAEGHGEETGRGFDGAVEEVGEESGESLHEGWERCGGRWGRESVRLRGGCVKGA